MYDTSLSHIQKGLERSGKLGGNLLGCLGSADLMTLDILFLKLLLLSHEDLSSGPRTQNKAVIAHI